MQSRLLTFTNLKGESIAFRNDSPFVISQINGLGDVSVDVQMQQAPFQDGSTYIDSVLNVRAISFTVLIRGNGDTDISQKRSKLACIFNPKLGPGTLEYKYGEVVRIIKAIPEHVPIFPTGFENRGRRHQVGIVDLICPNPYWQSPTIIEEPMAAFIGLFEFPLEFPTKMGAQGDKRTLINSGDVSTPVKITFNGPAVNPVIKNNTTNELIKVNRTLNAGDVLTINTEFGNKFVMINNQNVFHWFDPNSAFWQLQVGENEIEYTADSGKDEATVLIEWNNRYLAV